jgi:hypothetical protein
MDNFLKRLAEKKVKEDCARIYLDMENNATNRLCFELNPNPNNTKMLYRSNVQDTILSDFKTKILLSVRYVEMLNFVTIAMLYLENSRPTFDLMFRKMIKVDNVIYVIQFCQFINRYDLINPYIYTFLEEHYALE